MKIGFFLIVIQCLLYGQECDDKRDYKLFYPDSIIKYQVDSIIYSHFKGQTIIVSDTVFNLDDFFRADDSSKFYAPIGFIVRQDIGADLIVFATRGKNKPVIRGYAVPCEKSSFENSVFRYVHLQNFFKVPGTYFVFVFDNKKLLFIDGVILLSSPDSNY